MEKKRAMNNSSKKITKSNNSKPIVKKTLGRIVGKENRTEKILVENFIALQKVIVNMTDRFGKLGTQMEKLLNLFEASAEALAKKEFDISKDEKEHKKILDQIDNLLNQNKTIARSLALMHEVTHGGEIEEESIVRAQPMPPQRPTAPPMQPQMQIPPTTSKVMPAPPSMPSQPKPIPAIQGVPREKKPSVGMENYQASISSKPELNIPQNPPMTKPNDLHGGEENAQ